MVEGGQSENEGDSNRLSAVRSFELTSIFPGPVTRLAFRLPYFLLLNENPMELNSLLLFSNNYNIEDDVNIIKYGGLNDF